jgi:hypothetical protein
LGQPDQAGAPITPRLNREEPLLLHRLQGVCQRTAIHSELLRHLHYSFLLGQGDYHQHDKLSHAQAARLQKRVVELGDHPRRFAKMRAGTGRCQFLECHHIKLVYFLFHN